ncbi:hypothetical protein BJX99DRAFT_253639 [Aspergillus californicus]
MPALLSLPFSLLEDILALALDLPSALPSALHFEASTTVSVGGFSSHRSQRFASFILSVFLISRQTYKIAAHLIYKRVAFDFRSCHHLDRFLQAIGPKNRENLRYLSFCLDYEPEALRSDERTNALIQKWTDTLFRLPLTLRGLNIQFPCGEWPPFILNGKAPPLFRAAAQRFQHLEVLLLQNLTGYIPWDIFYISRAERLAAAFPFLRELEINGHITARIDDVLISQASSHTILPALSCLILHHPSGCLEDNPEPSLLADILHALPPLKSFSLVKDDRASTAFDGLVTQPFIDMHLTALTSRHAWKFQHLKQAGMIY